MAEIHIIILRQRERKDGSSQVDVYLDKKISPANKLSGVFHSDVAKYFVRGKSEVNVYSADKMTVAMFIEVLSDIKTFGWNVFGTNAYMNSTTGDVVKTHYFERNAKAAIPLSKAPAETPGAFDSYCSTPDLGKPRKELNGANGHNSERNGNLSRTASVQSASSMNKPIMELSPAPSAIASAPSSMSRHGSEVSKNSIPSHLSRNGSEISRNGSVSQRESIAPTPTSTASTVVTTRGQPPTPNVSTYTPDSGLSEQPLSKTPIETRPVISPNSRRKKSVCAFEDVEETAAGSVVSAPSESPPISSAKSGRLPPPKPQIGPASSEKKSTTPLSMAGSHLHKDSDDDTVSTAASEVSAPTSLQPVMALESSPRSEQGSVNAGDRSPGPAGIDTSPSKFRVGQKSPQRPMSQQQSVSSQKNAEYFRKLKEQKDEEKRRQAEKEAMMSPELLRKQKEAEEREKAHENSKTNHYARLGSAFSTGALRGAGGRQSVNLSRKGRGHPARG